MKSLFLLVITLIGCSTNDRRNTPPVPFAEEEVVPIFTTDIISCQILKHGRSIVAEYATINLSEKGEAKLDVHVPFMAQDLDRCHFGGLVDVLVVNNDTLAIRSRM